MILNNKNDRSLIFSRLLFVLLMTYALIKVPHVFISYGIIKSVIDVMRLIIKFEASGVMTNKYRETLIDDAINIASFIIYTGG